MTVSRHVPIRRITALVLLFSVGCSGLGPVGLTITAGHRAVYRCENGIRIEASYYALSDRSLDFVKLRMPDGKDYTLPRVLSASGARYTDDFEVVWWTKGDTAFLQSRDPDGQWRAVREDCRALSDPN